MKLNSNSLSAMVFTPSIVKAILPLTIIFAAANSFKYIGSFFYLVPLFYLYIIAAIWTDKNDRDTFIRVYLLFLPFGVWAVLTSLWSPYQMISLTRGIYFLLMSAAAAAIAMLAKKLFGNIFKAVIPLNIIIVLSSLASLLLGFPGDAWSGGNGLGFMGFAGHQNTLGALILFTVPAPIYLLFQRIRGRDNFIIISIYFLLCTLNFILLILTHSRASILSLAVMLLVLSIKLIKLKTIVILTASLLTVASTLLFIPKGYDVIKKIIFKNETYLGSNRWFLFEDSYRAALKGGIIGIGYGMSEPNIMNNAAGSRFEEGRYVREKGNSILALVEEVGLVGFGLFLSMSGYILWSLSKTFNIHSSKTVILSLTQHIHTINLQSKFLLSVIAALSIHAQFEGWWSGVGSVHLPLFFYSPRTSICKQ